MFSFSRRAPALALLATATVVSACGSDTKPTPPPPPLTVSAAVESGVVSTVAGGIKANGANLILIQVSGSTLGPIKVTAKKGTFPGGTKTATIQGTTGSVELTVCDSRTDASCIGTVTISATDGSFAFGQTSVTFVGFETTCNLGRDENHDSRVGCADPDCDQQACAVGTGTTAVAGSCQAGNCVPPVCTPTGTTEICDNGLDDDCDGKIDCAAAACDGVACKPGAPTFTCRSKTCTDVGSGLGLTVTPKRTRLPANGSATTTVTVKATKLTAVQPGLTLDFATDLGGFVTGQTLGKTTTALTGSDGTATVTYQASDTSGVATISVSLHDVPQVTQSALITMPALGSITLGAVQNQVMGVKYSGWNEQDQISVLLLDTQQRPYPDGLDVRFEHSQLGASTISTPFTADTASCTRAKGCLGFLGQTTSPADKLDTSGLATINLYSGTTAGLVSIGVTATAAGTTRTFTVQNIAVVGAKASGAHISLACNPQNVPGFKENNCTVSLYDGPSSRITCTVYLADRFNNVLGRDTVADFRTEAGSAGPPVSTKAYDPTKGGDQTADLGHASDTMLVTGYGLPVDVPPQKDPLDATKTEFSAKFDSGCGPIVHNPRDGLSSVMAAVQGEEGFVDQNGNGRYDEGEPFIDSGEPFVDVNDNGVRDDGSVEPFIDEPFIDVNQNGKWDGPNGVWDSDTVVWAEARVIYSGVPRIDVTGSHSRWLAPEDDPTLPDKTPPESFLVNSTTPGPVTSERFEVFFADENFNPPALQTVYSTVAEQKFVVPTIFFAPNENDVLGASFRQVYCDTPPPLPHTSCAATCKTAPCYRVTTITDFKYGARIGVQITGATKGPESVRASASIEGSAATTIITGSVQNGFKPPPP